MALLQFNCSREANEKHVLGEAAARRTGARRLPVRRSLARWLPRGSRASSSWLGVIVRAVAAAVAVADVLTGPRRDGSHDSRRDESYLGEPIYPELKNAAPAIARGTRQARARPGEDAAPD